MFIKRIICYFQKKQKLMPVEKKQWASIYANNDFINIETLSGYNTSLPDPKGKQFFINPQENDNVLGNSVLEALDKSRIIDPNSSEFRIFFDYRGRVEKEYKEWIEYCKKTYKYKTNKAMFKDMKMISIWCENDLITIHPTHHEKIESWTSPKNKDADNVVIPSDSSPEDIGKAVRLALSRCTSAKF